MGMYDWPENATNVTFMVRCRCIPHGSGGCGVASDGSVACVGGWLALRPSVVVVAVVVVVLLSSLLVGATASASAHALSTIGSDLGRRLPSLIVLRLAVVAHCRNLLLPSCTLTHR
jgi:hypothetical protein